MCKEQALETYQEGGYTVNIYQDEMPVSPREDDNLGKMVCAHRDYKLGDEELEPEDIKALTERSDILWLPLYLLDHSGLRINTGGFSGCDPQRWDWGQVGIIYVDKASALSEFPDEKAALASLQKEVEIYDQYLMGDVYGYVITRPCGQCGHPEDLDSCWGYYGLDYALEEGKAVLQGLLTKGMDLPHEQTKA